LDALDQRAPHYLRIYRELKRRIESGQLTPGMQLPAQRDLSETFNVTLMTLRQAMQLLDKEGLIVTRHGRGTFVAERPLSYQVRTLRSLAQEMAAQGQALTTTVLDRRFEEAPARVAKRLALARRRGVLRLERLRSVDSRPIVYQRSFLPKWVAAPLDGVDLSRGSLYDVLDQELGVVVERAHETIRAVELGGVEAQVLTAAPGSPAILSERLTFTTGERPIIYDEAFMPGDRVVVSAERFRTDLTVGYQLRTREVAMA
jgi:DNA-binding GntR family transcriptional regulator